MNKTIISICLTFIFTMFITAPLIITVIDKTVDISVFYVVNEEENNNNYEIKHKEVPFQDQHLSEANILEFQNNKPFYYYLNNYSQLSLEIHSPPPDIIIS